MKKKFLKNLVSAMKKIANTLSGDARSQWDEMTAAVEALEGDDDEHDITELNDRLAEIEAKYVKQEQDVANRMQALRNEILGSLKNAKDVKDQFTADVRKQITNAILNSHTLRETKDAIVSICEGAGIEVKKTKNSVSGLTFAEVIDYALQLKQENNDEIFDALYKNGHAKLSDHFINPKTKESVCHSK